MEIGIFAKTFSVRGADANLQAVQAAGFQCAQFNFSCVGLPSMPDFIPVRIVSEILEASRSRHVRLAALSATYNMIHPDHAQRVAGMRKLETMMQSAGAMGMSLLSLCTGTCDPHDQWKHHPDNQSPHSWKILRSEMETALALAEKYQVDLAIEPELANVVNSATAANQICMEINSPRLHVILDPANLFEASQVQQQQKIIADAVECLGDRIIMTHAKDRDSEGHVVAPGNGIVDFEYFAKCLSSVKFRGPVITHGLPESEVKAAAMYLRRIFQQGPV